MDDSPLALTPSERRALETIRKERPQLITRFDAWLADVLEDLVRTSQGRVTTEAEADDFLLRVRGKAVAWMLAEAEASRPSRTRRR